MNIELRTSNFERPTSNVERPGAVIVNQCICGQKGAEGIQKLRSWIQWMPEKPGESEI